MLPRPSCKQAGDLRWPSLINLPAVHLERTNRRFRRSQEAQKAGFRASCGILKKSFMNTKADAFLKSNGTLDILIHNAGIFAPPLTRDERGYEIRFATNHLGHFQLTERLWNPLNKSASARCNLLIDRPQCRGNGLQRPELQQSAL